MCRSKVKPSFVPKVDLKYRDHIWKMFPADVEEQVNRIEEMKKEEEKNVSIKFVYGNTYRKLKEGEYKLNPGGRPLDNSWTGYF